MGRRATCVAIAIASLAATSLRAQIVNQGQEVIVGGCVVTGPNEHNCGTGTTTTSTLAGVSQQIPGAAASYGNSWAFSDGSSATIQGSAATLSPISQQATLSSGFTNPSGYGGGELPCKLSNSIS
jgi:hypothetical protein